MDKVTMSAQAAVADIPSGASITSGGFGICGIPSVLLSELARQGATGLTVISNNCGIPGVGNSLLLEGGQIRRLVASYVGENKELERQYLSGEVEIELNPQGTLAERLRAGGTGIAAFYTRAGVGTQVADGGLPIRYGSSGEVVLASEPKLTEAFEIDGVPRTFVRETALRPDFALVRARRGDRHGNLVFRKAARNFNPLCAMAGRVTIAEVEELVEPGILDPDEIHLPGVFVQRVVPLTPEQAADKGIERLTVRAAPTVGGSA